MLVFVNYATVIRKNSQNSQNNQNNKPQALALYYLEQLIEKLFLLSDSPIQVGGVNDVMVLLSGGMPITKESAPGFTVVAHSYADRRRWRANFVSQRDVVNYYAIIYLSL